MSERTLYERLGGEHVVERIAGDIYDLHASNEKLKARFVDSDRAAVVPQVTAFIGAGTGGPNGYTGKSMFDAHRGMNISEEEYMSVLDDILIALDKNGIEERERQEVLAICYALKGEIIRV